MLFVYKLPHRFLICDVLGLPTTDLKVSQHRIPQTSYKQSVESWSVAVECLGCIFTSLLNIDEQFLNANLLGHSLSLTGMLGHVTTTNIPEELFRKGHH